MAPVNSLDPSSGDQEGAARQGPQGDKRDPGAQAAYVTLAPRLAQGKTLPPRPAKLTRPAGPPRPESLEPRHLGFIPQGMVSWFDPAQLIQTGIRTVVSSVFGSYADKR